jgi:transcriptional regulator with XRE-family HTH domain
MTKGFVYKEIGRRIRELRGRERQKDWAAKIGCDQGYISQVENGVTKPSLAFLKAVSHMTGSSIDWVLTGAKTAKVSGETAAKGEAVATAAGCYEDETLNELSRAPKLLRGVERLMMMGDRGRIALSAFSEMDDERLAGLVSFIAAGRK